MKSKTTIVVVIIVLLAAGAGVFYFLNKDDGNSNAESNTSNAQSEELTEIENTEPSKATDIQSSIEAWKTAGLIVSGDKGVLYQMVNASNGGKYDVGTTNVELYEYESAAKADEAKQSSFFTDPADTVFVTGALLVVIHSNDPVVVEPIRAVF